MQSLENINNSTNRIAQHFNAITAQIAKRDADVSQAKPAMSPVEYGKFAKKNFKKVEKDLGELASLLTVESKTINDNTHSFIADFSAAVIVNFDDEDEKENIAGAKESVRKLSESLTSVSVAVGLIGDTIKSLPKQIKAKEAGRKFTEFCEQMDGLVSFIRDTLTELENLDFSGEKDDLN